MLASALSTPSKHFDSIQRFLQLLYPVTVLVMEDLHGEKPNIVLLACGFNRQNEVSHSSQYPISAVLWTGEVEEATRVLTSSLLRHLNQEKTTTDFEILDFKRCKRTQKDLNRGTSRNKSPQVREEMPFVGKWNA